MIIGILTFHRSINNGAVMQAYSLSEKIKECFPESTVEIIDYNDQRAEALYDYDWKNFLRSSNIKEFVKKIVRLLRNRCYLKRLNERKDLFRESISNLTLSGKSLIGCSLDEAVQYINDRYDIVVIGSDAVWNYEKRGFPNIYFPGIDMKCIKYSYAASCYGMDYENYCQKERDEIARSLESFEYVGVRDFATEKMVKWASKDIVTHHTCDPTVFLDMNKLPINEEKLQTKMKGLGYDFSKPSIAVMGSEKIVNLVKKMFGSTYQVVSLYNYNIDADVNLDLISPFEWAFAFRFFKLTVTSYFHGTLLSLKNGVPVLCFSLKTDFSKKHVPKTKDLLIRLGLEAWYIEDIDNKTEIKSIAEKLLDEPQKELILERLETEAKSVNGFLDSLKQIEQEIKMKKRLTIKSQ